MPGTEDKVAPVLPPLGLRELTEVLVRHYGLSEGQYDLLVNYQIGAGMFGPVAGEAGPGVAVSLQQIGLSKSPSPNHLTVDAAKVAHKKKR